MSSGPEPLRSPVREEDRARLRQLAATLRSQPDGPRVLGYREVERAVEKLASELGERIPPAELGRWRALAIPRGGLVVLGLLAYALDLSREQLAAGADPGRPLLVVDDCALSGARFAEILRDSAGDRVVFAHLCSPPELRRAIAAAERRVEHCLAAFDLEDLAPRLRPDPEEYRAWRERWLGRLGADRYWIGEPELIAFPWGEPDRLFWNEVTERVERGWRYLPPDRCLGGRWGGGLRPAPPGERRLRSPEGMIHGRFEDRLLLYHRRRDRVVSLGGAGARMWEALATYGRLEQAEEQLLRELEVEPARLRAELGAFLEEMLREGLLERCGERS